MPTITKTRQGSIIEEVRAEGGWVENGGNIEELIQQYCYDRLFSGNSLIDRCKLLKM